MVSGKAVPYLPRPALSWPWCGGQAALCGAVRRGPSFQAPSPRQQPACRPTAWSIHPTVAAAPLALPPRAS